MPLIKLANTGSITSQLQFFFDDPSNTSLDLSKNNLGKRSVDELMEITRLLANSNVHSLNLSSTGLQLKSGSDLALFLKNLSNTSVTSLNLSSNWLGVMKTASELDEVFTVFEHMHIAVLNLSNNCLGCLKIEEIKKIFTKLGNYKVDKVQLDFNQFEKIAGPEMVADLLFTLLGNKTVLYEEDAFSKQVKARMASLHLASEDYRSEINYGF